MKLPRTQLPVYSPVTLHTLRAATAGLADRAVNRATLEAHLRDEYAATNVVLTDSGTSALAVALSLAAAARARLPAALPAFSCWDLATAAAAAGVSVRLYDIDPFTLTPDAASLARVLAEGVSSVTIVHLYGVPVPLDDIRAQVAGAGALVIEDAAQAFGALSGTARTGSSGDFTVLSFGRGKGISGGRGGAVLARGGEAAGMLTTAAVQPASRGTRELAVLVAQWLLGRPAVYSVPAALPALRLGESVYHEPHAPAGASGVAVAAVMRGWSSADAEAATRRRNAQRLLGEVGPDLDLVKVGAGLSPGYLRLPVRARGAALTAVTTTRAQRLGIMRSYPTALPDLPQLAARITPSNESFAGARALARELFTVPVHSRLTERDVLALRRWLAGASRAPSVRTRTLVTQPER